MQLEKKSFSLIFRIKLNCFDHALAQPFVRVARTLDWVKLKNLPRWRGQKLAMVGTFVFVVVVVFQYLFLH